MIGEFRRDAGRTRWLSVTQAARRLMLSRDQVRDLIRSGVLPGVKTGTARNSRYRVTGQAVSDYLARRPR